MFYSVGGDNGSTPSPRLSARRGSLSAPDPFALNKNVGHSSGQMSRLTIIRVTPSLEGQSSATSDGDFATKSRVHAGGRVGRSLSVGSTCTRSEDAEDKRKHTSFARSSFSINGKLHSAGGRASDLPLSRSRSASSSPESHLPTKHRVRSNSSSTRLSSTFQVRQSTFTPQQICDLAQTSIRKATVEATSDTASRSPNGSSPLLAPPHDSDASECDSRSFLGAFPGLPPPFIQLPETHFLPFVDRPSEVAALFSNDVNSCLAELLKQTFPSHLRDSPGDIDGLDPTDWSFPSLVSYMMEYPRSKASDEAWVANVRRCVHPRSEFLWERFKAILGVPPELDKDEFAGDHTEDDGDIQEDEVPEAADAWVEPIYPALSPVLPRSPQVISISPIDIADGGFGHGGRAHGMETIGEGEEDAAGATTADSDVDSTVRTTHTSGVSSDFDRIQALRLHTPVFFANDFFPPLEPGDSPSSAGGVHKLRSFSEGHADLGTSLLSKGLRRTFSSGRTPRPGTGRPVFQRFPGQPLFPSSLRRLSTGTKLPEDYASL